MVGGVTVAPAAPVGETPGVDDLATRLRELPALAAIWPGLPPDPPVWVVGGTVRDVLLGAEPLDLDLVVEGPLAAVTGAIGGEVVAVHDRFGTATVHAAGRTVDLVRARRERYPAPGALPEVEPGSLDDDLARRDFTVNAVAARLTGGPAGELRAVPGALEDLRAGRLRVLHDASFRDDPTRLLRLVRYAGRLDFAIDPATVGLARTAVEAGAVATVSPPRIGNELRLIAGEERAGAALGLAGEMGLLTAIRPGLSWDPALAARLAPDPATRMAVLARALTAAELRAWLIELQWPRRERVQIEAAAAALDA